MIARILVPLDGSHRSERALPYATRLAQATGCEMVLVYDETVGQRHEDEPPLDDPPNRLAELVGLLGQQGVQARTRIIHGSAADAILRVADIERADLIVMSTHGRGGLSRWLYGSVADAVLRFATRPVLLVTAACDHAWSPGDAFRVLVPLDGSALAETALDVAGELVDSLKAELLLLRVVEPADGFAALGTSYLPAASQSVLAEAQRYLDRICTSPSMGGRAVTTRVEAGDTAAKIARVAEDTNADLIVMATHGAGGLLRFATGSMATAVLHRATTPLLMVPPGAAGWMSSAAASQTVSRQRPVIVI